MGNDGGSIPTRRELVKEAAKALTTTQMKEVQNERQEDSWAHDPLTRKPLAKPVVSDSAGVLYNKESILEFLITDPSEAKKAEQDKVMDGRVKSLKDVVEVKFEVDSSEEKDATSRSVRKEKWVCPITGRELGPGAKAVYLVPCGHAFAGSVVKEVSGETCLQCNEPYAENDVIPILPVIDTDIARLNLRIKKLKEKGLTHSLKEANGAKKNKKRKKHAEKEANGVDATESSKLKDSSSSEDKEKKMKDKQPPSASNGIKNAATASLTKKVMQEQEERNKRRKLEQNANVKSLFSKSDNVPNAKNSADYMTRGFSIGKK